MKIYWKMTYLEVIQNVDEFGSSLEQIWRNYIMGAVRMRVQTTGKNITIIHKYSTQLQSTN